MMHDKMGKLFDKKKKDGKELSDEEKKAKMDVLNDLKSQASEMMGDKLKGLKKVSVASDSKEGLEMGLSKAKELLHGNSDEESSEEDESNEDPKEESQESPEEEASEEDSEPSEDEYDGMSEDEINSKLEKLMKLKEKMKK